MTGAKICTWVNARLLSGVELPLGYHQQIQPPTATKWLNHLRFRPQSHKKSIYIDGHERNDVVEYRKLYLKKLDIVSSTHLPPPLCEDGLTSLQTGNTSATNHLVFIFHDGNKNERRGLMVSDFVTEQWQI